MVKYKIRKSQTTFLTGQIPKLQVAPKEKNKAVEILRSDIEALIKKL